MKKFLLTVLVACVATAAFAQTLECSFTQARTIKATGKVFRSEGAVSFKAPDQLTMTYTDTDGMVTEFKFYQYYAESTGHISGGKIFVVVNGVGEFYTTNDLVVL